jgi:hypothetical protein
MPLKGLDKLADCINWAQNNGQLYVQLYAPLIRMLYMAHHTDNPAVNIMIADLLGINGSPVRNRFKNIEYVRPFYAQAFQLTGNNTMS